MSERQYRAPAICWLKVTDFIQGWVQHELGGGAMVKDWKVVSIQHLPGARRALRLETANEPMGNGPIGNSISATFRNVLDAGMRIDAQTMEQEFGATRETLQQYQPIECPKLCMTRSGVLRPWTHDVNFGEKQAKAVQRLLRNAFWQAVQDYSDSYAREHRGEKYAQIDMIEAFCRDTDTPDIYADAMRREWQRRVKREDSGLPGEPSL